MAAVDLKCDNGVLEIVDGDFVMVSGVDLIKQEVATALRLYEGEVRLDQRAGLPHVLWEPGLTDGERSQLVASIIRDVPGIVSVSPPTLASDAATRGLRITYEAEASLEDHARRVPIADTITITS